MKSLRHQYRLALDFAARDLILYFWLSVAIFMMMTLFSWYVFKENPDIANQTLNQVIDRFQGIMDEGGVSYPLLLLNNVRAGAIGLALGLIPFLFLPLLAIAANSAIVGLVLAYGAAGTAPLWKVVVFGILPHGIFELTAVFLCYGMGLVLCWSLTKIIIGRGRSIRFKALLANCLRVFLIFVLPLLAVAAAIETWITPLLLAWMV